MGHEPDFTLDVYGGSPFTPKQLYQGISKVSYSNIKWNRLNVDWKKLIGWENFILSHLTGKELEQFISNMFLLVKNDFAGKRFILKITSGELANDVWWENWKWEIGKPSSS